MPTFDQHFETLNPDQRKAVEAIEGPVMVVAGPGTGKTQVVAMRVANILRKAHVNPRSILCLTFSSSGATAMRERLRSLIGADAYNVTINTIHGFCNEIILQNPHVFETWASLEQISDVERFRAINRIIDDLLPDLVIVNKKNPYLRTKDILARISEVKREGKTLDDLRKAADEYDIEMHGKSKEGTKVHEKNVLAAKKFREFITIFEAYQVMLKETQRFDYDDMILNVIAALKEEDWLLASLQERYLYFLVDEYQDTNGAQSQVIELLTTPRTPEDQPNLFIVGDDDQAIYRFQGANLQNILSFHHRFPRATIITLTTSYRCTQPILDAAGSLISHNTERLVGTIPGIAKDLVSGSRKTGENPMLIRTRSDVAEPWVIADLIEEELQNGTQSHEIAILCQTNGELLPVYEVLKARGIAVQMDGKINLLDHPLVRQVLAILKGVENPENTAQLGAAFAAACFDCHASDLGRLFLLNREREESLLKTLLALDDPSADLGTLAWHNRDALIRTRDVLLDLHQKLPSRTLIDTLEHIYRDCKLLPDVHDAQAFDPLDFAALQAFFDIVRYRAYEQISFSFEQLLSDINVYTNGEYGLRLSYQLPHLTEEGVQLLTAHQSKGLEYDVVILANFRDGHWDKRRNPSSLSIPEDILFGWESEQKKFEQHQDERRVAYVAMTRAKRRLLFTCPIEVNAGNKMKDVSPSGFFAEAGALPERERKIKHPELASTLLAPKIVNIDDAYKAFLLDRLKDFRLSVTALNHFLDDPLVFLERDLLQMPDVKNNALIYGNAVHSALRRWGLSAQDGLPLGKEQFINEFQNYLVGREILTDKDRRTLMALGTENLPRYYEQRLAASVPVVYKVEFPLHAQIDAGAGIIIPIKGKLDRIDLDRPDGKRISIIDFKTGQPKTESQIRDGDYFRQLVFYALLAEQGMPTYEPVAFTLDFIGEGAEHPVQRTFVITDADKAALKDVIKAVWSKIIALDFTPL